MSNLRRQRHSVCRKSRCTCKLRQSLIDPIYLFNATDVLDGCFVGRMLAYGSKGPLLRRFIMFAQVERGL